MAAIVQLLLFTRSRFLTATLALALAVRVLPATINFVVGTDEALYLSLAQNLAAGRGFTEDGATPHTEFAPGYPFFAALVYLLRGGPELPARLNVKTPPSPGRSSALPT